VGEKPASQSLRVEPESVTHFAARGRYLSARCGAAVSAGQLDELTLDRPMWTGWFSGE
jgi:hypothetical protein